MELLLCSLDKTLQYVTHKITDTSIIFEAETSTKLSSCPYCHFVSEKVHSRYYRTIYDLPMLDYETIIHLRLKKFFCVEPSCSHKAFSEPLSFLDGNSRQTRRLKVEIFRLSLEMSSVSASHYLAKNHIKMSKSSICRMIKKKTSL